MLTKSLKLLTKGRILEFVREPTAMVFVLSMPIMWMLLLGLAFQNPSKQQYHAGLLWGENISSPDKEKKAEALSAFGVVSISESEEVLAKRLNRGEIDLIIDFRSPIGIEYRFDPNNKQSNLAWLESDRALEKEAGRKDILGKEIIPSTQAGSRYIDFLIPALLVLSLFTSSIYGTGMTIVVNRRENLLKRYLVSPMRPYEYILSHILSRFFLTFLELASILIFGVIIFSFTNKGSYLDLVLLALLSSACFAAISILCASRFRNASAYNGLCNLVTLPMIMIGGIWFSKLHFPGWMQSISSHLPLTCAVDAMRKITLEGQSILTLGFEISVLLIYTILAAISARKLFRWY